MPNRGERLFIGAAQWLSGQLKAILRALNDDEQCADVLQRLAAARGAINSLMAELMEDPICNHMPRNSKSSDEAAEDLIGMVRTPGHPS
jgi:DNA-binding FrmR family transcriptional regulator